MPQRAVPQVSNLLCTMLGLVSRASSSFTIIYGPEASVAFAAYAHLSLTSSCLLFPHALVSGQAIIATRQTSGMGHALLGLLMHSNQEH